MNIRRVKEVRHQFRSSVSKPYLKRPRRKKEDAQTTLKVWLWKPTSGISFELGW
ncbi:MAG: hypothetical protein QXO94_02620 [Candidatus Bathyarchaeia archaeon]